MPTHFLTFATEGIASSICYSRDNSEWELLEHCIQVKLAYVETFRQASLQSGTSALELSALPTELPQSLHDSESTDAADWNEAKILLRDNSTEDVNQN